MKFVLTELLRKACQRGIVADSLMDQVINQRRQDRVEVVVDLNLLWQSGVVHDTATRHQTTALVKGSKFL